MVAVAVLTRPGGSPIDTQADIYSRQVTKTARVCRVEVKTGKRRVIEYFLSPLMQYSSESLRER